MCGGVYAGDALIEFLRTKECQQSVIGKEENAGLGLTPPLKAIPFMAAASGKTRVDLTITVLRYLDLTLKRARPSLIEHANPSVFNDSIRDQFHLFLFGHPGPKYQTANGGDFMIKDVV